MPARSTIRLLAAASLLAGTAACLAQAADPDAAFKRYAGLHLGAHGLDRWPASVDFGGVRSQGEASLGSRPLHAGLLLGHRSENARFEIEWQHGRLPVEQVVLGPVTQGADASGHYDALTLNALRLFPLGAQWRALVGAGVGWGRTVLPSVPFSNGCQCFAGASRSGGTYQLRIGAEYQADARWRGQLSLSMLHLNGPRASAKTRIQYASRDLPSLNAGLLFAF